MRGWVFVFILLNISSLVLDPSAAFGGIVVAEGRSAIGNDVEAARQNALEGAIRNALIKSGSRVESLTGVNNGVLASDTVRLRAAGLVRDVEIIREFQDGTFYTVTIRATVENAGGCEKPRSNIYSKTVLFTAFPREVPESSRLGQLYNVDTDFPNELSRRIYPEFNAVVQTEVGIQLASDNRYLSERMQVYDAAQRAAKRYQVQFIASGSIIDMSMLHPDTYYQQTLLGNAANRVSETIKGWIGKNGTGDIRQRNFSFRVVLFDGISGEPLYDKTYSRHGIWDARYTEVIGFGTPKFWLTDYGKAVNKLIDEAVQDLGQKINCQPFMVPVKVDSSDEGAVYLLAGANNGVEVGDTFEVYVQGAVRFADMNGSVAISSPASAYSSLKEAESVLTVMQTYPAYSAVKLSKPLVMGNRYLAVAW